MISGGSRGGGVRGSHPPVGIQFFSSIQLQLNRPCTPPIPPPECQPPVGTELDPPLMMCDWYICYYMYKCKSICHLILTEYVFGLHAQPLHVILWLDYAEQSIILF